MADLPRRPLISRVVSFAQYIFGSNQSAAVSNKTVVVCPGKNMPAEVQLDADQRIVSCTRLPAEATCAEACNVQLQYSSEDLPTFLSRHEGKPCSECGASIGASDWYASRTNTAPIQHKSNLLMDEQPVCYACWKA